MFKHNAKITIGKYLLLAVFVICLIFTSFDFNEEYAYAVDVNGSSEIGVDLDVEDKLVNSQNNEILEVNSQDSQEVLSATRTPSGNSYSNIQDAVDAARDGDTILLKGTYYSSGNDCIMINKRLTITSDSMAVLNGNNLSMAFYINNTGAGSVFTNLKFIYAYGIFGSAVFVNAKNVKFGNCIFEDNHSNRGGALNSQYDLETASGLIVENCQFRRNNSYHYNITYSTSGAALTMYAKDSEVRNSIFEDNWVKSASTSFGGAIQVGMDEPGSNGKVINCVFKNNRAISFDDHSHGGAGCIRTGTSYTNCTFINNTADEGGALTYHGSGEIKNCTFINNTAGEFGGALSTGYQYEYMELTVTDCFFDGNSAPMGGAVQANGMNILINHSSFKNNNVSEYGGAIYARAEDVTIMDSIFDSNRACIDGGAIYIEGKNTFVDNSSFICNVAIPDINKLDDGLGGAIYINSSQALIKNSSFRLNTARNGSAIYYDKEGENLTLENNELFQNQAWVYGLPILARDIDYGDREEIKVILYGGNNIGDFDNLAVSNAIFNAASSANIAIDGEYPVYGATDSGELYQDSREYNIEVLLSILHEDGTLVYNETGHTSYLGEIIVDLDNLKPGKYFVSAMHYEDTYYKAIRNATTFAVNPKVDNEVKKSVSKEVANYEDVITWTITITNHGPNNSTHVRFQDVLPDGLIWLNDTSNGLYNHETGMLMLESLSVNETFAFDIITVINTTGEIINKANVTSNESDTNLSNNYAEKRLLINPSADISVVKSVSNARPNFNDTVVWTIEISNNGLDIAHNVEMRDLLPKSLIYVDSDGNYNVNSGIWAIEALDIGEKIRLNIECRVNGTGLIENSVSVNATEYDYDLTNNNCSERIFVSPASDLAIVKTVNASNVNFKDIVKWTLSILNKGPDNATNVKIRDLLPEGFICLNNDTFIIECIEVGQRVIIEIVTLVESTGEFVNYANASSDEYDYDLTNNEDEEPIHVNPAADLSVIKSVSDENPNFNDVITWTVEVFNGGPDPAHNVTVVDLLPDALIWLDDDSLGNYNPLNGVLFINWLDVDESYTLNIDCMVNGTGLICNNVTVNATEYDYNLTNNFANETIDVEKSADLAIIKLANNSSPNYNDLVKWTLVISNYGPDKATDVYVEDILPGGLRLVSYNATKGFYDNGIWSMCCLNEGDSEILEIICRVEKTGEIINFASIYANEYDCNPDNNMDNESINVPLAVDLEVTIEVSNANPLFGEEVNWMISVKNNGPDNATEAILEDILPNDLIFLEYESSKGIFEDYIWDIGSLNVGEQAYLNITTFSNALGIIINGVNVGAKEYDWDLSNNHDEDMIDVKPIADLSVDKSVDNKFPNYGEIVKWTVTALNQGPNVAHNVIVRDILPNGLTFISSNAKYSDGIWDIGNLAVGEEKSLEIICKVASTGAFKNLAAISADEIDLDESNNLAEESIQVNPASDLSITKIASKYNYKIGEVIEYVIEIVNNGPDSAQNIKVTEILDDLLKLKSFKATKGKFNANVWTIDALSYGESAKLFIKAIAVGSGILNNSVCVTSDTFDYDLSNNDDFAIVNVTDNALNKTYMSHNSNSVEKSFNILGIHKTSNPIVVLMISLIFTILFSGAKISKK